MTYLLLLSFETPPSKNDQQWIREFISNGKFYRSDLPDWENIPDLDTQEIYFEIPKSSKIGDDLRTGWNEDDLDCFLHQSTKEHFGDWMDSKFHYYHFE